MPRNTALAAVSIPASEPIADVIAEVSVTESRRKDREYYAAKEIVNGPITKAVREFLAANPKGELTFILSAK